MAKVLPRYPIYVPSKGRWTKCLTARFLLADGVPFRLVVEPQEADAYAAEFGSHRVLELPFRDAGTVVPARNWIMGHAIAEGHERHWQMDDNILWVNRRWRAHRLRCSAGVALAAVEDFTDRYENIAISGLAYQMFVPDRMKMPPFYLNVHVYSCFLTLDSLPYRWRGRYNEDTDFCLQVLSGGWCTVLVNAFSVNKMPTMHMAGGNTEALQYFHDGRLRMAKALERAWPGVVETKRRFQRPQHVIRDQWRKFDTPLKLKPGVGLDSLPPVDEYGMRLVQVAPEVKSPELLGLVEDRLAADRGQDVG